eukprot:NODE_9_length_47730_cov_0.323718.p12 type:complete len:323 gc:universal NODE_9_length_47730_cov_0.323718:25396-26364(+)
MEKSLQNYLRAKNAISLEEFEKNITDDKELMELVLKYISRQNSRIKYKCLQLFVTLTDKKIIDLFFDNLKKFVNHVLKSYSAPPIYHNKSRQLLFTLIENNYNSRDHPRLKMAYFYLKKSFPEFHQVIHSETSKRQKIQDIESSKSKMHKSIIKDLNTIQNETKSIISDVENVFNEYIPDFKSNGKITDEIPTGITKTLNLHISVNLEKYNLTNEQNSTLSKSRDLIDFKYIPQLKYFDVKINQFSIADDMLIQSVYKELAELRSILKQMSIFSIRTVSSEEVDSDDDDFEEVFVPRKRNASSELMVGGRKKTRLDLSNFLA